MSETAEVILGVYFAITMCTGFLACLPLLQGSRHEKKMAARVILFCWAWPILLGGVIQKGAAYLWDTADIGRGDRS